MKRKLMMALAVCPLLGLVADMADPQVSNVSVTQDSVTRRVTVTYNLDEPAIITMDVLTNGVSIGDANIQYVTGDCNRLILPRKEGHTLYWRPEKSWPGYRFTSPVVSVRLTAWATNAPPDYMVADLITMSNVCFYTSEAAIPGGLLANEEYRRTKIVMRKIHQPASGKWTMGVDSELGKTDSREDAHEVSLTRDYYMGVFPITQDQWRSIVGEYRWGFAYKDPKTRGMRPANTNMQILRRCNTAWSENGGAASDWPNAPYPTSFIGLMRTRTGIDFDLPSEMEWEYACRAGHGQGYWGDGSPILSDRSDANLDRMARYGFADVDATTAATADLSVGTSEVGSKEPNDWGLYDMNGNIWEWCLDWYNVDIKSLDGAVNVDSGNPDNPLTGVSTTTRVKRGGYYGFAAKYCRASYRDGASAGSDTNVGIRMWAPAEIR